MSKASSDDRSDGRYLAAFDREGKFTALYFPSNFSEIDWPIAGALQLALAALTIHAMFH